MFQRFRSLATSTVLVGLVAAFACSAPADEDDDGEGLSSGGTGGTNSDGGTSSGTNNNASNTSTTNASNNNDSGGTGGTGGTAGTGGAASGSGSTTTGPAIGGDLGDACAGIPYNGGEGGAACVGTGYEAESFPIDLVLMVDVSSSMVDPDNDTNGVSRWDLVHDALVDFVTDPEAAEIGMGIQFWSWIDDNSCNVDNYSTPAVPIGELGDIGDDIVEVLNDQDPGGLTPTYPALQGAIEYAKAHAEEHPARQAVVVFVTDGYPTECQPQDIPSIADLATASWSESPKVPVFVVGIDGVYNLDQIAAAGGTREPFLVENDGSTDRLVSALKNITTDTARCEFEIPPSPNPAFLSPDTEAVQVIYTPGSGDAQEIPRVSGYAACASAPNGGWYTGGFDADGKPTKIVVCPCSCANFGAGSVEVTLGCKATPSVE